MSTRSRTRTRQPAQEAFNNVYVNVILLRLQLSTNVIVVEPCRGDGVGAGHTSAEGEGDATSTVTTKAGAGVVVSGIGVIDVGVIEAPGFAQATDTSMAQVRSST
jgi:hypothetical protein